ncbi:MAG TPA: hypothetical protein VGC05_02835 [Mycobacterium sp.]
MQIVKFVGVAAVAGASSTGGDAQIPMALFIQAWDAGGELMAVTS